MTAVDYGIDVHPRKAVLGQPLVASLSCRATAHVPSALTFVHRSLVIEVMREGLAEPELAFPNRFALEDRGRLVRKATVGGVEELQSGDERTRSIDLVELLPEAVLVPGILTVTYRLEEAEPIVRPPPVEVEVGSGPAAVPLLIGHLSSESGATRSEAAEVLRAMTANDFGYQADADVADRGEAIQRWWSWWHGEGSRLPWNFDSAGATFGRTPGPHSASGLSEHLGGIAYPARPA